MLKLPMAPSVEADSVQLFFREILQVPRLKIEDEIILGRRVFWMVAIRDIRMRITPEGGKCDDAEVCKVLNKEHRQRIMRLHKRLFELSDIRRLEKEGISARERMIEANLRLVVSIAKRYSDSSQSLLDLTQEGTIGLHRGIEKYDPEKGYRLSTYVTWWIRQSVSRAISDKSRQVRLSVAFSEKLRKIKRCESEIAQERGEPPAQQELIAELIARGLVRNAKDYHQAMMRSQEVVSLDQSVSGDDDVFSIIDRIAAPGTEDYPEEFSLHPLRRDLDLLMATLTNVERTVIEMKFGIGAFTEPHSYDQIAAYFGGAYPPDKLKKFAESAMRSLKKPCNRKFLAKHR